jgi:hypothetical protein
VELGATAITGTGRTARIGRFQPVIFGWMVHVYPYEDSFDKIFAMHHHMD